MEKIKLDLLGLSSNHSLSSSFTLILTEKMGSKRKLPIVIGTLEAQSIIMYIQDMASERPMTHDLFISFIKKFNIKIIEVIIYKLSEGVFHSLLILQTKRGKKIIEIDSRPSDAIALALRFNAPLYASEEVMDKASINLEDIDKEPDDQSNPLPKKAKRKIGVQNDLSGKGIDELKSIIDKAIEDEDYEKAAKIRDEIKRRE